MSGKGRRSTTLNVGANDLVMRVRVDLEEKEAREGQAKSAPGQKFQEGTRVSRKHEGAEKGEEKGTEPKGGERKCCCRTPVTWPV